MPGTADKHAALVESIRESGQLVPVLLRPHPGQAGRFQIAYGHRRVRALAELGRPVRAVVRKLSDDELVVAQGKENGEREDLSFIERATYALALEVKGFKRETIMAALSVDKTELSRLISVARALPRSLVSAIGAAPKTGRRRWMDLVERYVAWSDEAALEATLADAAFAAAPSDERFLRCARRGDAAGRARGEAGDVDGGGRPQGREDRAQQGPHDRRARRDDRAGFRRLRDRAAARALPGFREGRGK